MSETDTISRESVITAVNNAAEQIDALPQELRRKAIAMLVANYELELKPIPQRSAGYRPAPARKLRSY